MKFLSDLGAVLQLMLTRRNTRLFLNGTANLLATLSSAPLRLRDIQEDLRREKPLELRLPFGIVAGLGHETAGLYLFRAAAAESASDCTRLTAIQLIGSLQHDGRIGLLLALAQQEHNGARKAAMQLLKFHASELYYQSTVLQSMLLGESDPEITAMLIDMLFVVNRPLLPSINADRDFWEAAMAHQNCMLRISAFKAIGGYGQEATDYVPYLSSLLGSEGEEPVKVELLGSLSAITTDQTEAAAAITGCLTDSSIKVASAAFSALTLLGPLAAAAAPQLTLQMLGKEPWRRRAALKALQAIGISYQDPPVPPATPPTGSPPLQVVVALDRKIWSVHEWPVMQLIGSWTGLTNSGAGRSGQTA